MPNVNTRQLNIRTQEKWVAKKGRRLHRTERGVKEGSSKRGRGGGVS